MHSCLVALCGAGALARESADPTIPPGNFAPCFTAVTKDGKPKPWFRIGLIAILTFALSGWTCSAIVGFQSCLAVGQTPQITSLSPNAMSANATSVLLIVIGNNFVPPSQILWNGNTLVTTFVDSQHLQATITQQTFTQFGGSRGSNVLISVTTPASATAVGCPIPGSSATLVLAIN